MKNNLTGNAFLLILITLSSLHQAMAEEPQSSTGTLVYRISAATESDTLLHAELELPESLSEKALLYTRGMNLNALPQITNLRCGGSPVIPDKNGKWHIPKGCSEVSWQIELVPVEPFSLEIARQQSVLVKSQSPWILLSEFSFLPRIEAIDLPAVIEFSPDLEKRLVSFLPRDEQNRRIISPGGGGPVFLVFGLEPISHDSSSSTYLTYLVDDPNSALEINGFYSAHLESINYMRSLFSYPAEKEFSFSVIWAGLNREGGLGGAAGNRAFLINYPCENGKLIKDKFIWALMTAFHEQFHVLYYGTGASQPNWANESLAQYYAIKSLEKAGFADNVTKPLRDRFFDTDRKIDIGLIEANRRFESESDFSVYHLFYDQGATFWFELDTLIRKCTRGEKDLDNFMGALSKMTFTEDGSLPLAFLDLLDADNIEEIEALLKKHL